MLTKTRLLLPVALVALLATGCSAVGAASPTPAASPKPVATLKNVTASAAPMVMTDGEGDEVVTGVVTDVLQTVIETYTTLDDHEQVRGGVVVGTHMANDVRATGKLKMAFSIDWYTKAGPLWADATITNDEGTWAGPCLGAAVARGGFGPMTCWFTGAGAYEGYTYFQANKPGGGVSATTEGIIYKGAVPTP